MPNIELWWALGITLIWIISLIICYLIIINLIKTKYQRQVDQANYNLQSVEQEFTNSKEQLKNLELQKQALDRENSEISKQLNIATADIKNLKNRIEEYLVTTHELNQTNKMLGQEKNDLHIELTQQVAKNQNLSERLSGERIQLQQLNDKFQKEFENLAQKILDEKSEKFAQQNKENLSLILNPLQDRIKFFEKKVEDTHKESIEHGARLQEQILGLKVLNEQMSVEANNLTRALKGDSKTQGNWGEMILESVLEKSGLQKDSEYFVQSSHRNDEGKRIMPDVIIELPGNKKMIIDAKVSLTAYEKYVNEVDQTQQSNWIKSHVQSIQRHIQQLSKKNYQSIYPMDSPDFVLLFIPIESAFAIASQENPSLYQDAFDLNIIIVTPTTLLAVLRTIDSMWQNEKQKQNAIDIARQAGKLYDTFVNLLSELEKVGQQMDTAKGSYNSAMKKLTGNRNLFKNIQNLKSLGAKTSKQIDQKYLSSVENNNEDD